MVNPLERIRRLLRREREEPMPHVWGLQQLGEVPVDENRIPLPGTPPEVLDELGFTRLGRVNGEKTE
jgi:hypothetical protein